MRYEKVYVEAIVKFTPAGEMIPLKIVWEDGGEYEIDRLLKRTTAPPRHVGGYLTVRYEVRISGRVKELYFETDAGRWFVEKASGNA